MVGSIGVIIEGANFEELMKKVGIKSQVAKAGKYKQIGTAEREWTDFERAELDKVIQGNYDMFTTDVAEARRITSYNVCYTKLLRFKPSSLCVATASNSYLPWPAFT